MRLQTLPLTTQARGCGANNYLRLSDPRLTEELGGLNVPSNVARGYRVHPEPRATPRQRSTPFVKPPTTCGRTLAARERCRERPTTRRPCDVNADEMPAKAYEGAETLVTNRTGAFSTPAGSRSSHQRVFSMTLSFHHVAKMKCFVRVVRPCA